ncbi:septum formation inhibitor Maf [Gillisia hiemivivida]|uniref:Septum formation inhibitor Maf n=1 Tax=Gillisia hiemivivida TaxID=291190 RepID=A0A5C6ZTA1_9FLAO|nr:septum formation inhibitor Maf [Gillisia hiemivivida]TXD93157.1 septum formation inhibitor Maf [Gillisia hiemivivida]
MRSNYYLLFSGIILLVLLSGCRDTSSDEVVLPERNLSEEFKSYWFNGEAEITSYKLDQSRYGESREGTAVLIYVTEEFLRKAQVKANAKSDKTIPILKLNSTKKFNTGIYPYSIMQSTFYPLEGKSHALKISASIQEWCGHVYMQLNNRDVFKINSHSYFEGEADQDLELSKTHLENEVWTQLRINPELLPTGDISMIPSFEYLRLAHQEIKAYNALAEFYQDGDWSVYKISYPELKRNLKIYYSNIAPFKIEKWQEEIEVNGKLYTTTATKMNEIKSDYWNKNSNKDLHLREQLNLN